jgi:hypothetical protein
MMMCILEAAQEQAILDKAAADKKLAQQPARGTLKLIELLNCLFLMYYSSTIFQ